MNSRLDLLQPYPFARLAALLSDANPNPDLKFLSLAIGEPKHPAPEVVRKSLCDSLDQIESYPPTAGSIELRQAIAGWANNRFELGNNSLSAEEQVLPVNGTREALFAITQALTDPEKPGGTVAMPNPFYQIYEGAAILAGKQPYYLNCQSEHNLQPDWQSLTDETWQQMELLYICSPGNPSGTYIALEDMQYLIEKADKHDFIVVSDECYSELYLDPNKKAPSILQACRDMGRTDFSRCIAFHSLSKRSNLPGLRSGFVAGDAEILKKFLSYRTYHGSAMSGMVQQASIAAWSDESHAEENRQIYREKYAILSSRLEQHFEFNMPQAAFYLWLNTPIDDQEFCKGLYQHKNLKVVPGSFLARDTNQGNPGVNKIRIALVAPLEKCIEGIDRLIDFNQSCR